MTSSTRAGYVALVGRPNVGKSTLLNRLAGEKLSIVTAKEQTTRERVTGLVTTEAVQMIFVDTPGLLEPRYLLQRSMLAEALMALADADVVLLLLDGTQGAATRPAGEALERLKSRRSDLVAAVNKTDAAKEADVSSLAAWAQDMFAVVPHRISADRGDGVTELRAELESRLPESPFYYPADDIAVQPVRFFVAELVRETIFESYEQEVPYSTVVRVEEFRESADPLYIRATIYVERDSQKGILIGSHGAAIRALGKSSREKIEAFLGRSVYLDLWVKPLAGWRRKKAALKRLGYSLPPD
ncbi:MAG: GTPase Era [Gemmatimonadota bacterium]|jgi:GTPase